jgi:thiol-disulfide isomerase/thioredoxin
VARSQSLQEYSLSGTVNGCKGEKIILSAVYGKEIIAVDSSYLDKNCAFHFAFKQAEYKGLYRLSISDSNYADIIFNKENIIVESGIKDLGGKMKIGSSVENKLLYFYKEKISGLNDSISRLTSLGQQLYEKDAAGNAATLKKLAQQIELFNAKKRILSDSIISKNPKLFISEMLKASLLPDFRTYMKKKDAAPYPNEAAFLKEHFFDNLDFADSNLLHTDIIFDKIGEYFQYFADPPSVENYKTAIDFILIRSAVNKNVSDYIFNTMMRTFDHSDWDEVYTYVVDMYLAQNTCSDNEKAKSLAEKSSAIKSLKPGSVAPAIITKDIAGKTKILDSLKSRYTLVVFWGSWCEFCEKAMPELKNIYSNYHPKGLEIFSVSLDSITQNWIDGTTRFAIPWINTCDLKGFDSPVIKEYNIWRTPTYFLLDSEKKIIARPANTVILKEKLKSLTW